MSASPLPEAYAWLASEPGPRMVQEALANLGFQETAQAGNAVDPQIKAWAEEAGISIDDQRFAWCGLYMGLVAHRSGKPLPSEPLRALDWASWGEPTAQPMLGDVLVFTRTGGGHVTLYVGEDDEAYHCVGGNQSRSVCVTRIAKSRNPTVRRPHYNIQPDNVRPIALAADGELGASED